MSGLVFSVLSIVLSTTLSTENLYFFKIKYEYKFHPKSIFHPLCFPVQTNDFYLGVLHPICTYIHVLF